MQNYSIIDGITLSIALLGAVLGMMNTWRAMDRDRVKLKVVPKFASPITTTGVILRDQYLCIEITNFSTFPLVIREVGFFHHGTKSRSAILQPILPDNGPFPRRLEPRTSFTVYNPIKDLTNKRS